ncbi:MAG: zf-HC2 domain-containing protein [Acidobacteria bacterium]|nr:zf-HC2 domain-containing protein [Acidobacteriota bacterium]
MMCYGVDRKITGYVDGRLSIEERGELQQHLAQCRQCRGYAQQIDRMRSQAGRIRARAVPQELTTSLCVIASREASLRRSGQTSGLAGAVVRRFNLWVGDLMRPFAIPFAGGVVSAIFLFSMLVPTLTVLRGNSATDVPTMLSTEASIKDSLPLGETGDGVVVDLVVDESGRMVSYSIPDGQGLLADNMEIRRAIENKLLVTRFEPATFFGQPTSARLRISFRRSTIDVRG